MTPWVPVPLACCALAACGGETSRPADERSTEDPGALRARAAALARELIIVDTHVDLPDRLTREPVDVSGPTSKGDFDYPRAKAGGLDAPFMSVYVPAAYQETGGAKAYADRIIDLVESLAARSPDRFALARSPAEVREQAARGLISLPMGMENGAAVEDDLDNLRHFHARGIRYITLTHSANNQICDSSYADVPKWNGLSPFGRLVVAEMNRLGIMVDISHVSDPAARQVLELSRAPVIASHSSCRRFTPDWQRNISDELIQAVAAGGGAVCINFGSAFLTEAANAAETQFWKARARFREENGLKPGDARIEGFELQYWKEHSKVYADVTDVVAHVDHVARLAGVDHVCLGSDFDGVGDSLPTGLKDVSGYPSLIEGLLSVGYSEEDVRKICGENVLRVWGDVQRAAREFSSGT